MNFIYLDSIILDPPLNTLLTILLGFCLLNFTKILSDKFKIFDNKLINIQIFFFLIVFFILNFVFLISLVSINIVIIKYFILIFIIINIILTFQNKSYIFYFYDEIIKKDKNKILLISSLIIFLIISLTPASDVDSLDYHIGVPLSIIRDGYLKPNDLWLHSRLIGLGEYLNLIGLSVGLNNFGSFMQFISLLMIIKTYKYFSNKYNSQYNFTIYLLSAPLFFTLLLTQKILLLPCASILLSILILFENLNLKKFKPVCISFIILFYAVLFKFSFFVILFSTSIIFFLYNFRNKIFYKNFYLLIFFFLIIVGPFMLKNYFFYQDPLSPFFEFLKNSPDKFVLEFAKQMKIDTYKGFMEYNIITVILFPVLLFFTSIPYLFARMLGFGSIYLYLIFFKNFFYKIKNNIFFILIVICNLGIYLLYFKQLTPRYFIEIYLIMGLLLINTNKILDKSKFFKYSNYLIKLEFLAICIFGIIVITFTLPALLNKKKYEEFMMKNADGYHESIILKKLLPKKSIDFTQNSRSYALFPRKHLNLRNLINSEVEKKDLKNILNKYEVLYGVVSYPINYKMRKIISLCNNDFNIIEKFSVRKSRRNPLLKLSSSYSDLALIKIKCQN